MIALRQLVTHLFAHIRSCTIVRFVYVADIMPRIGIVLAAARYTCARLVGYFCSACMWCIVNIVDGAAQRCHGCHRCRNPADKALALDARVSRQ